ncbi:DUF6192 family protein [Streptomyces sp. NPDC002602]|uniref:DUF6192 family protein n=1 Tax=Streptomyces sp. NPDC002602 TaxID=3364654 RepID=UPI0036BBF1C9
MICRSKYWVACARTGSCAGRSRCGPGRRLGSKNRWPAARYDVGRVLATGESYTRPEPPGPQPGGVPHLEEKAGAIYDLARDEQVAAAVTTELLRRPAVAGQVSAGLLRRPDVAFKAMSDDRARHEVSHAQVERGRQAREHFEGTSPVAPAVRHVERTHHRRGGADAAGRPVQDGFGAPPAGLKSPRSRRLWPPPRSWRPCATVRSIGPSSTSACPISAAALVALLRSCDSYGRASRSR